VGGDGRKVAAMSDGSRTWALVVGIDVYADKSIPQLTGAANDAIAAVNWLRAIGVPDDHILLHIAPSGDAAKAARNLGLTFHEATLSAIWSSVGTLEENTGDRLFVFLSGHGFYEPTRGRLFLTQDARQRSMTNLGINLWITYLTSLRFKSQYLVMDGCQNYPYTPSQRMKVEAALYPGVAAPTPEPGNALVAFFAASQGEIVPEIDGRGAYMRRFFELADPVNPLLEAVALDFATGRKSVLARTLHRYAARMASADAAALRPPVPMHPGSVPYGRAESMEDIPLIDLDGEEQTSAITITIHPAYASADISGLRLRCLRAPYWERRLPAPPETAVAIPVRNRLPRGLELGVDLEITAGSAWHNKQIDCRFSTDIDREVSIDLADLAQRLPTGAPGAETAVVLTVDERGVATSNQIPDGVYSDIERQAHSTATGGGPVTLRRHESGPDLVLPTGGESASWLLGSMADRILEATPPEIAVMTALDRVRLDTTAVRFGVTPAHAARLAGPLQSWPTVAIASPGTDAQPAWRSRQGHTLLDLARNYFVPITAGAHEIRLELPWASWSEVIDAPLDRVVPVLLPESLGIPPLRVVLSDAWPAYACVVGGTDQPSAGILRDERRDRERALIPDRSGQPATGEADRWVLRLPDQVQPPTGQRLIHLTWPDRQLRFPARTDGVLGVDTGSGTARVEPLSHVPQPLWDLLVATGRLDALTADESHELSYGKWEDPILGLASAYALQDRHPDTLPTIIGNLRRLGVTHPDLVVLEASNGIGGLDDSQSREAALHVLAAASAVPVLRWGVPMARLLVARHRSPQLREWDRFLARVEVGLSPTSIWTAWSDQDA
jgi:hypothetical protein